MGASPESNAESINAVLNALTEAIDQNVITATKSFGGYTLATLQAKVQPSLDARAALAALELKMTNAINARNDADKVSMPAVLKVIQGVAGDPDFGDDSSLYEDMGRVRKSERKSGKTNKTKKTPA